MLMPRPLIVSQMVVNGSWHRPDEVRTAWESSTDNSNRPGRPRRRTVISAAKDAEPSPGAGSAVHRRQDAAEVGAHVVVVVTVGYRHQAAVTADLTDERLEDRVSYTTVARCVIYRCQ